MLHVPLILIVDDYPDNLELAAHVLEAAGYRVLCADNAVSALALARRCRPAAILMDICLPGLDGIEATRLIRADPALAATSVVACSAAAAGIEGAEELFDGICPKPCLPDQMQAVLRAAIAERARLPSKPFAR